MPLGPAATPAPTASPSASPSPIPSPTTAATTSPSPGAGLSPQPALAAESPTAADGALVLGLIDLFMVGSLAGMAIAWLLRRVR